VSHIDHKQQRVKLPYFLPLARQYEGKVIFLVLIFMTSSLSIPNKSMAPSHHLPAKTKASIFFSFYELNIFHFCFHVSFTIKDRKLCWINVSQLLAIIEHYLYVSKFEI